MILANHAAHESIFIRITDEIRVFVTQTDSLVDEDIEGEEGEDFMVIQKTPEVFYAGNHEIAVVVGTEGGDPGVEMVFEICHCFKSRF